LDWAEVARNYGDDFKKAGGDVYTGYEVRIRAIFIILHHTFDFADPFKMLVVFVSYLMLVSYNSLP